MRECKVCKKLKPLTDFYKHTKSRNGHSWKCKECTKVGVRANRETKRDYYRDYDRKRQRTEARREKNKKYATKWRANNADKRAAHVILNNAVRDKRVEKKPCVICGTTNNIQAHHYDYAKPLEVVWFCCQHHIDLHNGKVTLP